MKYIVMLGDGMADYPLEEYGGRTPLEVANTPNMDFLAQRGMCGRAQTVPFGMPPGSDTANLAVMGYDPKIYYSGRSPLEAVSMGIAMGERDVSFRCNLVTLSDCERYEDATMIDYSSGEISSEESHALIAYLKEQLSIENADLYAGISYRHCFVLRNAETGTILTPPHDITGKPIANCLPQGKYGELLLDFQKKSWEILKKAPVNLERIRQGKRPANSCWFWGEGTKPAIPTYREKFGLNGGVVSAVDLIKGLGICAGLEVKEVCGATGNYDTNFAGKAQAAIEILKEKDFVYIHVEAPDECSHHFDAEKKIYSIEQIDQQILSPLLQHLRTCGEDYSLLLLPDHPTPVRLGTHVPDPVPFVIYRSNEELFPHMQRYDEKHVAFSGIIEGHRLMDLMTAPSTPKEVSSAKRKKRARGITITTLIASLLCLIVACLAVSFMLDFNKAESTQIETKEQIILEFEGYDTIVIDFYAKNKVGGLMHENGYVEYEKNEGKQCYKYTANDYRKIEELNESHIYGFYILADEQTTDEVCKALGYRDLADYLKQAGYADKHGLPDIIRWKNAERARIAKYMKELSEN